MRQKTYFFALFFLLLTLISVQAQAPTFPPLYSPTSPFNQPIPTDAIYTPAPQIGSFRPNLAAWSMPIYRITADELVPPVEVVNIYSGRVEKWYIPRSAQPAAEDDAHLGVIYKAENVIYELWKAFWTPDGRLEAGGMVAFPLDGTGISDSPDRRVTAAGFAVTAGMVLREDFINPATGLVDFNQKIDHALSMSLHFDLVQSNAFVPPAINGEVAGRAGKGGIPMGARFALARGVDVDSLTLHPFSRELLRAARDYGLFVNDTNGAALFGEKYVGNIRVEPGLIEALFGQDGDSLINTIQSEVYTVIERYGLYRVTTGEEIIQIGGQPASDAPTEVEGVVGYDVTLSAESLVVAEGGPPANYSLALSRPPSGVVTVLINTDVQLVTDVGVLTFNADNWDVPQIVNVYAYDDKLAEATGQSLILHLAQSADDRSYAGIDLPPVTVTIEDND
jgi:hypothetical protein